MEQRILRKKDAMEMLGYRASSTFYLHISQGIIPKPIKLGPRSSGWLKTELQAVLDKAIAARDAA